jgi:nitrogen regulatory protein P-II 1
MTDHSLMKEIKAFIRPHQADHVIDALEASPESPGVTVSRVRGFGHPKGGGPATLTEQVKLEIVVPDADAEGVVDTIAEHAHTGRFGDGKIFVYDVADAVRIRTGERGEAAVQFPSDP